MPPFNKICSVDREPNPKLDNWVSYKGNLIFKLKRYVGGKILPQPAKLSKSESNLAQESVGFIKIHQFL
jgi:hypothetical protein